MVITCAPKRFLQIDSTGGTTWRTFHDAIATAPDKYGNHFNSNFDNKYIDRLRPSQRTDSTGHLSNFYQIILYSMCNRKHKHKNYGLFQHQTAKFDKKRPILCVVTLRKLYVSSAWNGLVLEEFANA